MKVRCLSAILVLLAAPAGSSYTLARETAVFEAALRQQLSEHLDTNARAQNTVICLGINPGEAPQGPNREFMARFGREPAVRRLTECDPLPSGAVEGTTRRPAVIVTAGPIEWRAEDEAWVTVVYFRTSVHSATRLYRVVRDPDGWVSLGPILWDGPA